MASGQDRLGRIGREAGGIDPKRGVRTETWAASSSSWSVTQSVRTAVGPVARSVCRRETASEGAASPDSRNRFWTLRRAGNGPSNRETPSFPFISFSEISLFNELRGSFTTPLPASLLPRPQAAPGPASRPGDAERSGPGSAWAPDRPPDLPVSIRCCLQDRPWERAESAIKRSLKASVGSDCPFRPPVNATKTDVRGSAGEFVRPS
jgi:hypothetical protein